MFGPQEELRSCTSKSENSLNSDMLPRYSLINRHYCNRMTQQNALTYLIPIQGLVFTRYTL